MDTAPTIPADVATMLTTSGTPVIDAAAAAGISPPPGIVSLAPAPAAPVAAAVAEPVPGLQAGAAAPVALVQAIPAPANDVPTFVGNRARSRTIPLEWPLLWQGQLFEAVVVTRPTTGQVSEYFDRLMAQTEASAALRFPVFYDVSGAPVPDMVMDALDPDDSDRLMEALSDFLPGRLRRLQAPPPASSQPGAGEATGPTS